MTYTPGTPGVPDNHANHSGAQAHQGRRRPATIRDEHLRYFSARDEPLAEKAPKVTRRSSISVSVLLDDGSVETFTHQTPTQLFLEEVCARFARGTLIATRNGPIAIEDLRPGDRIRTGDNSHETLRWVSACTLPEAADDMGDRFWPIRIRADALGELRPIQDLIAAPHFRILSNHPSCNALFGSPETLAPVSDLFDGDMITRMRPAADLMFYNLMFDTHQIIEANGLKTESYHPGNYGVAVMSFEQQSHLRRLMPHLRGDLDRFGRTVRPVLRGFEAEALRVG